MAALPHLLFVGEGVTLSHAARPAVLAASLPRERFQVTFACPRRLHSLFAGLGLELLPLDSEPPHRIERRLRSGEPLFDAATLERQVATDLRFIDQVQPDLVVADLRQSLAVSAELARVPVANLVNAHWSPHAVSRLEAPEHPLLGLLGEPLGQALSSFLLPVGSAWHSLPINLVRERHGLRGGPPDVRHAYSFGDLVLHPDVPELEPTPGRPSHHHYLGPIFWEPPCELPAWWGELDPCRPLVYVNLGSSGAADRLAEVVAGLAGLPVEVAVATAGRSRLGETPANVHVATYLPGGALAERASLVVTNGGVMAAHQGLAAGKPVLGIPGNLDQILSAKAVRLAGAGDFLRARQVDAGAVRGLARHLLADTATHEAAQRLATVLRGQDAPGRFRALVEDLLHGRSRARGGG